ncbi:MAG: hypothetical protein Q8P57_03975 [Candidatus Pacearchaeota archaeon]|nr:hypothetical protein [Candidatus Pacearchaeota archaeon]
MIRSRTEGDDKVSNLFEESKGKSVCPFIERDGLDAYCSKGIASGEKIQEGRRMVCDIYSLQLWCLNPEKYEKCIYYLGEPFPV